MYLLGGILICERTNNLYNPYPLKNNKSHLTFPSSENLVTSSNPNMDWIINLFYTMMLDEITHKLL